MIPDAWLFVPSRVTDPAKLRSPDGWHNVAELASHAAHETKRPFILATSIFRPLCHDAIKAIAVVAGVARRRWVRRAMQDSAGHTSSVSGSPAGVRKPRLVKSEHLELSFAKIIPDTRPGSLAGADSGRQPGGECNHASSRRPWQSSEFVLTFYAAPSAESVI